MGRVQYYPHDNLNRVWNIRQDLAATIYTYMYEYVWQQGSAELKVHF